MSAKRRAVTFTDQGIRTREELKDYIVKSLGYPLFTVELTDEQLDTCIDNATLLWTKYADLEERFVTMNLSAYENEDRDEGIEEGLDLSEYNVAAVHAVNGGDTFGMYGGDSIWGLSNCMLASGTYPFIGRSFGGQSYEGFTTLQTAFEFVKMAKRVTAQQFDYRFFPTKQKLVLYPNPTKDSRYRDTTVCFQVECIPEDEELYGNDYVKRLAIAYAKITLGIVRSKFQNVTFAGGITVNAEIGKEGQNELDGLMKEIKSEESCTTGFFYD